MENKNIIIMMLLILAVVGLVLGVMLLQPTNGKEATELRIKSNKTLTEGDALLIQLSDLNKTPLSKEKVTITVKNSKGKVVVNKTVITNSKGLAKLDSNLKKGKYVVNVTYVGNENYTASNATQKLTIKEKAAEVAADQSSSGSSGGTHVVIGETGEYALMDDNGRILENLGPSKKHYPNNPNAVDYPDAEPMSNYINTNK